MRSLSGLCAKLKQSQQDLLDQQSEAAGGLGTLKGKMAAMDDAARKAGDDLMRLTSDSKAFWDKAQMDSDTFNKQSKSFKEQIEFLMQATEMIKRKAREATKTTTAKFTELSEEDEKLKEQLAAIERGLKRQEREVRTVSRAQALPAPPAPPDPNERLAGVLQQLEAIAAGGDVGDPGPRSGQTAPPGYPMHEQTQLALMGGSKTERPPLPLPMAATTGQVTPRGSDLEFARARLGGQMVQTSIDSARSQHGAGFGTNAPSPRVVKKKR